MILVDQTVEVLNMDSIELIEHAGRTCYQSEKKPIGCTDVVQSEWCDKPSCTSCQHHSSYRFVEQLIKRGHEAMLEHAGASVRIVTNRAISHELVRHRLASYAQESQRYVMYNEAVMFVRPTWMDTLCGVYSLFSETIQGATTETIHPQIKDNPVERTVIKALLDAEIKYRTLLRLGLPPEEARDVLPNATKTEIVMTANYREWRHFLKLRYVGKTGRPHPQMKALASNIYHEFLEAQPALFKDIQLKSK